MSIHDYVETFVLESMADTMFGAAIGIHIPAFDPPDFIFYSGNLSYEQGSPGKPGPPSDATLWEIGSVTKTFTAAALASAVTRKSPSITLSEKVIGTLEESSFCPPAPTPPLPESWKHLENITFEELGNFSSGMPHNWYPSPATTKQLFSDLTTLPIGRSGNYAYSNAGFAYLANALQLSSGVSDYQDLLSNLIESLDLTMNSTQVFQDGMSRTSPLPIGYTYDGQKAPAKNPTWPAFDGAGAIVTTAPDYMTWLKFNMGDPTASDVLSTLRKYTFQGDCHTVSLAWELSGTTGETTYAKNGGVPAFSSYITYSVPTPDSAATYGCFVSMNRATRNNPHLNPAERLGEAIMAMLGVLLGE